MTETKSETGSIKPKIKLGVNYWRLWTSSVISNLGDGVTAIALPWLASAVTRNPILIALVAVASRIHGWCSPCWRVSSPIASTGEN